MYVKVYISRMEMSQKVNFCHQNLLKIMIFWEMGKKRHLWCKQIFGRPTKRYFEFKKKKEKPLLVICLNMIFMQF